MVARWQLIARGVTRHEIQGRLDAGALVQIHKGVYLVGAVPSEHAYPQAALLAYRNRGILSHWSAAAIWKLRDYPSTAHPWVTLPESDRSSRPGIQVRCVDLSPADVRHRHSMRLTSPPRTVLDCASTIEDAYEVESLIADAKFRRLASEIEMKDQLARNPGRRGITVVRKVLDLPDGPRRTRSKGERAFLRLLRKEGINGYETNSNVFGPELDFVWSELRFAVEVDGWDGHSGSVAFERDRLKIAELQARGIQVMPVTGRQIRDDRRGVINRLVAALTERKALSQIDRKVFPL